MSKQKDPPPEVAAFFQAYLNDWIIDGWEATLKFVEDEFHLGWMMDVYTKGNSRYPEAMNIPVDGSVPHFMISMCIRMYQKGYGAGNVHAGEQFVIASMVRAAEEANKIMSRLPMALRLPAHIQQLSDYRKVRDVVEHLQKEGKNENN